MFTLIYLNSRFNKPTTLLQFLQGNIGNTPMLCVDCVTPYMGTDDELAQSVCDYLSNIVPTLSVKCNEVLNVSKETTNSGTMVKYLNLTIHVSQKIEYIRGNKQQASAVLHTAAWPAGCAARE